MYVCIYNMGILHIHVQQVTEDGDFTNLQQYITIFWEIQEATVHSSKQAMRERNKGRNEQGNIKVQVFIIFYVQLAHLLFVQVNERTNMEEEYLTTTVYLHKSLILPASLDSILFKIFILLCNFLALIKFVPRGINCCFILLTFTCAFLNKVGFKKIMFAHGLWLFNWHLNK